MRSWLRVGGFAVALALILAIGFSVGRFTTSTEPGVAAAGGRAGEPAALGGVTVSAAGYTLSAEQTTIPAATPATLRLRIVDPQGRAVLRYGVVGDRLIRLAVVRRDLSGYQLLTPSLSADGTWTAPVTLPDAGSWRLLADFTALDDAGKATALLLGLDLSVPGAYSPHPVPAAGSAEGSPLLPGGYEVAFTGSISSAAAEPLLVTVTRDGKPLSELDPGARLTVLREGDLASLSVPADTASDHGVLRFWLAVPSPGRYRAFLDFSVAGSAHTAAFDLPTHDGRDR